MSFRLENLGRWSPEREFKVTAEHVKEYAAATNDAIAAHVTGELAPPLFAVVPQNWIEPRERTGDPDHPVLALSEDETMRVLHGEQDIVFHQPIRPGTVLRSRLATVGVHGKRTGTTVTIKLETTDADDQPVNTQHMTLFYRGVQAAESAGEPSPTRPTAPAGTVPLAIVTRRLDADQTTRYAQASGDHMPIHLDDAVARSVGLPGIIIHGLCTLAVASQAIVAEVAAGDSTRLKRLGVRFSDVVLPEQSVTTTISQVSAGAYAFVTTNNSGTAVLTNGYAEVSA